MTVITKQLDETNEQVKLLCEQVENQTKSIEEMKTERNQQTETIGRLEASNRELGERYAQLQQATMVELEKLRGEHVRAQTELTKALIKLSEKIEGKATEATEMESENECVVIENAPMPRTTTQAAEETKKKAIPVKRAAPTIAKAKTTAMAKQASRTQETRETGLVSLGKYKLGTRVSKSPGCEQIYENSSRESDTGHGG
jgi:chromosome segregation ATPase